MIGKVGAYWDMNGLSQMKTSQEAAKAFEGIFVKMLLSQMRKSIPQGALGSSLASGMYQDMLDMQLAEAISASGRLGLGEYVQKALEQAQAPNLAGSLIDTKG